MTSEVRAWQRVGVWLPEGATLATLVLAAGLAALALPAIHMLATKVWAGDEQGHGPVILAVSLWFLWQRRHALLALPHAPWPLAGWLLLVVAVCLGVLGRSQDIAPLEVLAPILAAAAVALLSSGIAGLKLLRLPLLFLLFTVPLPGIVVQTVTAPLKMAVSAVAESLLANLDYPVARTGVIIAIDQYHLLVADACAGLTSMFTLEALGLVYLGMRGYTSRWRNALLAVSVVPIAFIANVVRVVILILVTYHFGDEAGQGFVHRFAGAVLFFVATLLMLGADRIIGRFVPEPRAS
jgi:exosortase B